MNLPDPIAVPNALNPIKIVIDGALMRLFAYFGAYEFGGLALSLLDADTYEAYTMVSVNLPESRALPSGAFYVRHWGENEEIVAQLVAKGILLPERSAPVVSTGHIDGVKAYRLA